MRGPLPLIPCLSLLPFLPLGALFLIRLAPGIAFQSAAVAAPGMIGALGLDHAQIGLVLGAFMLPGIVVTVPAGLLAQRVGDRVVIGAGLCLIAAGALVAFLAPSLPALLAGRAIGVAVLMLLLKMTADRYAGPWLATASAVIITAWPVGLALGLVLFGPVPAALGWRATLGLAAVPALAALLLVPLVGRAGSAEHAAVAGGSFPPLRFVVGAVLCWGLINAVFALIVTFLPGYLLALGRDLPSAARVASLAAWSPALGIPLAGILADRFVGRPAAVLAGLAGTGLALMVVAQGHAGGALMIVLGLAFSAAPGPLTAQLGAAAPQRSRAVVFGWYSATSYAAMTVAPWAAGWLRDATGSPAAPLLFAAALSLCAIVPYGFTVGCARRPASSPATV